MRLPRRTPFYAPGHEELQYVHALLYGDANDVAALQSALKIARLWMARAACPQAVEATSLLVQARLLDGLAGESEGTRAAYAMGLVRFVNSIVDTFQTGMFAQSIGAIADRIGLPQWLVQVRHFATHEELPSMAVCREACTMALAWLDQHYWQPTLSPSHEPAADVLDDDEPRREAAAAAAQLLHTYRMQAHALARDRSLALRGAPPLVKTVGDLEQWVQAETARRLALASDGSTLLAGSTPRGEEHGETFTCTASVLMLLVTQLLLPGALIPQTKEQRALHERDDAPLEALPSEHTELWDPLLRAMHAAFPVFLPILIQALAQVAGSGTTAKEKSYAAVARAWLAHLALDAPYDTLHATLDVPRWRQAPSAVDLGSAQDDAEAVPVWDATQNAAVLRRIVLQHCMEVASPATWTLAQHLAQGPLAERVAALIALHDAAPGAELDVLPEMEARSRLLRGLDRAPPMAVDEAPAAPSALPGWSLAAQWQPTPIGCVDGARPPLLL